MGRGIDRDMVKEKIGHRVIFICWKGLERSVAMSELFKDFGVDTDFYNMGTQGMKSNTDDEVKKQIDDRLPYIIYSQGSSKPEFEDKEKAVDRLKKLGYSPVIKSMEDLMAMVYGAGGDPEMKLA